MYPNLDAEMARNKLDSKDIADVIGLDRRSAWNKIVGKTRFFYDEAAAIRDNFFPEMSIEYLFNREGEKGKRQEA